MPERIPAVRETDLIRLFDSLYERGGFVAAFSGDGTVSLPRTGYAVWATPAPCLVGLYDPFMSFVSALKCARAGAPRKTVFAAMHDGEYAFIGPASLFQFRSVAEHFAGLREEPEIIDLASGLAIPVRGVQ